MTAVAICFWLLVMKTTPQPLTRAEALILPNPSVDMGVLCFLICEWPAPNSARTIIRASAMKVNVQNQR